MINGQKVWTTNGQYADLGFLLARTDPTAPSTPGITRLRLRHARPGVTVRPLREITGTPDFNEVFLDNVRVPATAVIGAARRTAGTVANEAPRPRAPGQRRPADPAPAALRRGRGPGPRHRRLHRSDGPAGTGPQRHRRAAVPPGQRRRPGPAHGRTSQPGRRAHQQGALQRGQRRLTDLASQIGGPAALLGEDDPGAVDGGRWAGRFPLRPGPAHRGRHQPGHAQPDSPSGPWACLGSLDP